MNRSGAADLSKVPEVTLVFWIIKIAATTLGETGGDAVSMSMNLGYLVGTLIFAVLFALAVSVQIAAKRFHPWLYWLTIVATTTVGTTLADFADRSLGIGYAGGSALLPLLLLASLFIWYRTLGTVAVSSVSTPRAEMYYWITIMFSQTLGTALGDWTADKDGLGLGYGGSAVRRAARGAHRAVLGRVHPHAPNGRGIGRFPRQASGAWRPGAQPLRGLRRAAGTADSELARNPDHQRHPQ